jgi:molybdopterin synthase catalytic subunit
MTTQIRILPKRISAESLLRAVSSKEAGGTVLFLGTVRNRSGRSAVTEMHVESAQDLARRDLERISSEAVKKFKVTKIAVAHRVGSLKVGETIVGIAVSAPHRAEAFSACRFIIDELKRTTPIWKKERAGGKDRWVR